MFLMPAGFTHVVVAGAGGAGLVSTIEAGQARDRGCEATKVESDGGRADSAATVVFEGSTPGQSGLLCGRPREAGRMLVVFREPPPERGYV